MSIFLWLFIFEGYFLHASWSIRKTWKFDNDVLNPEHWEDGGKECDGFFFPEILGSVGSVTQLVASQVILPLFGQIEIRNGGYIEISDVKKCVRVKELIPKHWLDPENWESGNNAATPDAERVPCEYDDVVFPDSVAVYYPEVSVSVSSIEMRGVRLTRAQWKNFLQSDYGVEQFQKLDDSSIAIQSKACSSKSGCKCHSREEIEELVCEHVPKAGPKRCFRPIRPAGFCRDVCGGAILAEVAPSFSLETFRQRLPKYDDVDAYVSKIAGQKIQIVFVDQSTYTGRSPKLAAELHGTLLEDLDKFKLKNAILQVSGIGLPQGSVGATTVGIVFGTLIGILAIFFCLYVLYVGPLKDYDFRSRLTIRQQWIGKRRFFFSKFDNEGVSMAASMVSLEKSFDNPMYGTIEPSTSNAIVGAVTLMEEQTQGEMGYLDVIEDVHDTDED